MGYLLYVSHEAENLQFFLWLQDYKCRFYAASPSERALSPEWDKDALPQPFESPAAAQDSRVPYKTIEQAKEHKTRLETKELPLSPIGSPLNDKASFMSDSNKGSPRAKSPINMPQADIDLGMKWKPCELQMMAYALVCC